MYIKVPSSNVVTVTSVSKRFFEYNCTGCGKHVFQEHVLETQSTGRYSQLSSSGHANNVQNSTERSAQAKRILLDRKYFKKINIEHKYGVIKKPVVCPYCGTKQIWSMRPFRMDVAAAIVLFIFAVNILFWSGYGLMILALSDYSYAYFVLALMMFLGALAFVYWPIVVIVSRVNWSKKIKQVNFVPPVYYSEDNIGVFIDKVNSLLEKVFPEEIKEPIDGKEKKKSLEKWKIGVMAGFGGLVVAFVVIMSIIFKNSL